MARTSRRAVLGGLAALGAAACTGPPPRERQVDRRQAVVVGAGLAGLTAAFDLERGGWQVEVLEASARVGGRVHTLRGGPLPADAWMEAGADRIAADHAAVLRLAEEVRVPLVDAGPRTGLDDVVCLGSLPTRAPGALSPDEATALATAREVLVRYADPDVVDVAVPAALRALDPDPRVVRLLDAQVRDLVGHDLSDLSAGFVGTALAPAPDADGTSTDAEPRTVEGGMDVLVSALADALAAPVRTNHAVTAISQGPGGAIVTHSRGQTRADRVVLAVPAPVAATLDLGDPDATARFAALPTGRETRVLLVYEAPSWRDEDLSGRLLGDGVVGTTAESAAQREGGPGLLVAGAVGGQAVRLVALAEAVGAVKAAVDACMPAAPFAAARPAVTVAWHDEPWALGGRPGHSPATWGTRAALAQPIGLVHVAGDHTGTRPGTLDAAVESGRRAAAEVLATR